MIPVDVGEDDAVNVVRCQAAPSKRGDDVRRGAHWLAGRDVFADWGGVCGWVAAKAKVEEQASCFGDCGTGGVLDKEGKGRDHAGGGRGAGGNKEALREG